MLPVVPLDVSVLDEEHVGIGQNGDIGDQLVDPALHRSTPSPASVDGSVPSS
jgi:hypothetical protein